MEKTEAMKILKDFHDKSALFSVRTTLDTIFPELKENEDERIREGIIRNLEYLMDRAEGFVKDELKERIAWLEKQGESYTKRDVDDAYLKGVTNTKNEIEKQYKANYQIRKDIATFIFNYKGDIKDRAKWMDYLGIKVSFAEKQGKQKPNPCDGCINRKGCINCENGELREVEQKPTDKVEPFDKYEGLTDFERTLADICIGWIGEELGWKQYIKDNADILLKIAIKMFNSVQDVPFEQNPAWSEEDEEMLSDAIGAVGAADYYTYDDKRKIENWLKSLKDRYTWKPSDEQLIAHCFFANGQVKYDNYSKYYQNKDTYEDITENS